MIRMFFQWRCLFQFVLTPELLSPLFKLFDSVGCVVAKCLLNSLSYRLVVLYNLHLRVLQVRYPQASAVLCVALPLTTTRWLLTRAITSGRSRATAGIGSIGTWPVTIRVILCLRRSSGLTSIAGRRLILAASHCDSYFFCIMYFWLHCASTKLLSSIIKYCVDYFDIKRGRHSQA